MATVRTVNDLLKAALTDLGVISAVETPTAEDAELALETLQDLLAEWSDGGLVIPVVVTEYFAMVVGQATYTIGESGSPSKNTVRPEKVIGAYVRSSGIDSPVNVIGDSEYRLISQKTTSGTPDRLYPAYTAPNCTFYLYPVPDSTDSLYFTSQKTFTEPNTLTEALLNTTGIPRNYYNALRFNLAVDLSMKYEKQASPLLVSRAISTKTHLKNLNLARMVEPVRFEWSSPSGPRNILEG